MAQRFETFGAPALDPVLELALAGPGLAFTEIEFVEQRGHLTLPHPRIARGVVLLDVDLDCVLAQRDKAPVGEHAISVLAQFLAESGQFLTQAARGLLAAAPAPQCALQELARLAPLW